MNVLEVDSVMLNFGHRQILSDVYIKCCTGETIGLLGRNGSGKSTLMKIIFGILDTDNKHIKINGKVCPYPYKNKGLIVYLPQHAFLPKEISLSRITALWIDDNEKQNKILQDEIVKENINKSISELSSGERRYFEVLLLANLPSMFMLLDEPFSAIAPLFKEKIKGLINSYKHEKGIIVTDHDYRNIIEISDRTILIDHGICRPVQALSDLEKYNYLPAGTVSNENTNPVNPLEVLVSDQFAADEQTLKDLELPNMDKEGEIFRIFNFTQTKGGTAVLERC